VSTYHTTDIGPQIAIFKQWAAYTITKAQEAKLTEAEFGLVASQAQVLLQKQVLRVPQRAIEWTKGRSKYAPHQGAREKARRLSKRYA